MKKTIAMLIVFSFLCCACGNTMVIDGREYDTVGLVTEKNPDIEYRVIIGNVVWSVLLCSTVIAPIYFLGFSIQEPVGLKSGDVSDIGTVK